MNYVVDHIPLNTPCRRRQGVKIIPTTITIHNTSNPSSSAANERAWLLNPTNDREASWHIVVDERQAIEAIPTDEKALHAGAASGNSTSIGIEICESGDYAQTLKNAAQLVAKMLRERGWGIERLRRHWDWSGKICPRLMYDGGKWTGWEAFKKMVAMEMTPPKEDKPLDKACVIVNGQQIADGRIIDGSVYVPLRAVGDAIGAKVGWTNATKTATLTTK